MIVCLDTNTVVQATSNAHEYHSILNAWVSGRLTWAVSTPILLEYEEVHRRMDRLRRWQKLAMLMDLAQMTEGNLLRVTTYYEFHVISEDPDDNKFVDCAIAADADYVVSDDRHFAPLADAGYKSQPITPTEFIQQHLS